MNEVRFNNDSNISASSEDRTIRGTAIVFNSESNLLAKEVNNVVRYFREVIKPEAVTQELISNSDIFMLYNHNDNNGVLARSKNGDGTLKVEINGNKVDYSFDAPDTQLGNDMLVSARLGNISSSSFKFRAKPDGQTWEKRSDGTYTRYITKPFDGLYDFSMVPVPAYDDAVVDARGLEEFIQQEEISEKEKRDKEEAERLEAEKQAGWEKDLSIYYDDFDELIKNIKEK
jgi:uncharacterized protein